MTELRELNPDFRDVLLALAGEQVEFLVVGAHALAFHGVPRFTGDLDLLVRPSQANAAKVWRALVRFGAPIDAASVTLEDLATPGIIYQIGLPPSRIDILTEITGVTFDEAWASREAADLEGVTIHFLGRDALVRNKQATGRTKDLADVARLKR
jgi:glycine cleavage system aminomethyltransferase T